MVTKQLEIELERCLRAVKAYQASCDHWTLTNPAHAAAMRATMDLTKVLAKWRQTPTESSNPK